MPRKQHRARRTPKGNPRGVISVRPGGFGFVQTAEGEFYVPEAKMNGAFDGDLVEVALLPRERSKHRGDKRAGDESTGVGESQDKRACRVVNVVQRAHDTVVGRYEIAEPFGVVIPDDPRINYDIFTLLKDAPDVPDGAVVTVRISSFPTRNSAATGVIEEVLGNEDDERLPIDLIVARHKLETRFSDASLTQAKQAQLDVAGARATGYRDITDRVTFTVDPADARDFDDAVSLDPVDGFGTHRQAVWRLGVHIGDVSHYVPWGSSIDLDARRRATSVYLVDRVIPMLPEQLSNDLCSLVPHEARRTMTVDMYLDKRGRVLVSDIYPALIRSCARLTYGQALASLEQGGAVQGAEQVGEGAATELPAEIATRLAGISRIAKQRAQLRKEAGGINFDTVEARVRLDADGVPVGIDIRRKNEATELIEESMILANETVARFLSTRDFPCIYRVHERPAPENLEGLAAVFNEFPWFRRINQTAFLAGEPHAVAQAIEAAAGRPEAEMVTTLALRSMKRAVYDPVCDIHYGLASEAYCHFTSPIRRYPDLVVHRMLKAALVKRPEKFDQEVSNLPWIAEHSSQMERIAEKAARESQEAKIVELMEAHLGETFSATVAGVAAYGLFVRLENTAEGMVRVEDLGREYFHLDAVRHRLVGTDTGKEYRLGQRLAVVLVAADRRTRRLDFRLANKRKPKQGGRSKKGARSE